MVKKINPKPFQYEYGLQSSGQDAAFKKIEIQDDKGNVYGEVVVALPDGRVQTTNYNADFYDGYVADVKYVGTPIYPPEQQQSYNGPKFIPVHMKARPVHQKQPVLSKSKFQNFPYRKQQRPSVLSTEEKSQRIIFQTEKINSINSPAKGTRTSGQTQNGESMAEIMAKVREDLKNMKTVKANTISTQNNNANPQLPASNGPTEDSMAEIMKKVREDLKKLKITPAQPQQVTIQNSISTNSEKLKEMRKKMRENIGNQDTPSMMKIKSHVINTIALPKNNANTQFTSVETTSQASVAETMKKVREDLQKLGKLRIDPQQPQQVSFQKVFSTSSGTMNNMRKKMRENIGNQQMPPMMKIKSHVMPGPTDKMAQIIKQMKENRNKNKKKPQMMSIKSHVISSPPPVESMAEIMK